MAASLAAWLKVGPKKSKRSEKFDEEIDSSPAKRSRIDTSTNDAKKKEKKAYDRDNSRQVKGSWFKEFEWLEHDEENRLLFCNECRNANMKNVFSSGKQDSKPKKDDYVKHQQGKDHKTGTQGKKLAGNMAKATKKAYSNVEDGVIAHLRTILTMAKEAISSVKANPLVEMQVLNGCDALKHLRPDDNTTHYTHPDSMSDFYTTLAYVVKEEISFELDNSVYNWYALEMDEATDCSNKSVLVVYIRFMSQEGVISSRFLSAKELPATCASDIYTCLLEILEKKNLDINNLIGVATDGAGVMVGCQKGVTTLLKKKNPNILANHCMAHRLQLVSEKAASNVGYVTKYIGVLNEFAKALKFSAKLERTLFASKELHGEEASKIKQVFFTRWLSFTDSVQALSGCIGGVISTLQVAAMERGLQGRAVLHGVLKQMSSYKFIMMTHFLSDAVGLLGILSKLMQKENTTVPVLQNHIDGTVLALQVLLSVDGAHTKLARKELPSEPDGSDYSEYKTHDIKDTVAERAKSQEAATEFIEELVTRLAVAFPDHGIMSAFSIFDPAHNDQCDMDQQLETLLDFYGKEKTNVDRESVSKVVNPDETRMEWSVLRGVLKKPFKGTMLEFIQRHLHGYQEVHPNLSKLATCGLVMPVTSVSCERAISKYNYIKTDLRNSLSVESVDTLMVLALEAGPVATFNYASAFEKWITAKDRGSYSLMVKNEKKKLSEKNDNAKDCELINIIDVPLDLTKK